jgi:hypothetical protein
MRLGAVTLVLTRSRESGLYTVGLYSYLYNVRVPGDSTQIPRLTWDSNLQPIGDEGGFDLALEVILKWGPYERHEDILDELLRLPKMGGTKVQRSDRVERKRTHSRSF